MFSKHCLQQTNHMIWLIVGSLFFVILGSCQSQHEGSKNNIQDPYIVSKPPALGEEKGGENRGIVSDMITGGLKEILRPKGPGGGYYPNGGGANYQYGETETESQNRGIFSDMITGGLKEIIRPKGPGGGYYPNGGGGGYYPNAGGGHHPSAGAGGHYPTGAGAGAQNPSTAGAGANYQYGESETEQQDFQDYSTINNMESDERGENRGIVSDMITGGIKEILRPKGPGGRYYPNGGGANYQYGESETEQQDYQDYSAINDMESDGNRGLGGIIGRLVKPISRILRPGIRPGGRFPIIRPSIGIGGGGPSYNYGYEYDTYGNYQEDSELPPVSESPYIGFSLITSTTEPPSPQGSNGLWHGAGEDYMGLPGLGHEGLSGQSEQKGNCMCGRDYRPVCGKNGATYSNSCVPCKQGVEIMCKGKCPCPGPEIKKGGLHGDGAVDDRLPDTRIRQRHQSKLESLCPGGGSRIRGICEHLG